jgi:hypothetical protein
MILIKLILIIKNNIQNIIVMTTINDFCYDFVFGEIFNKQSDIHITIMSFIKGQYIYKWNTQQYIDIACKMNYVFMVTFLKNQNYLHVSHKGILNAIKYGHINILLNEDYITINDIYIQNACKYGHLHLIKYLNIIGFIFDTRCADLAAMNGHLHILQHLKKYMNILCTDEGANAAAQNNHKHILEYLLLDNIKCNTLTANYLAKLGNLELICILRDKYDIHCDSFGANWAAQNGNINIIINLKENGIICNEYGLSFAINNNYIDIIHYIRYQCNILYDIEMLNDSVKVNNIDLMYEIINTDILPTVETALFAASFGRLDVLKYLKLKFNIICNEEGPDLAAENGHLHIIRYLGEIDQNYGTTYSVDCAARYGHIHIIQYLQLHNIICDSVGADYAAWNGHLDVLMYIYSNSDVRCDHGLEYAMIKNHHHIIEFLGQ